MTSPITIALTGASGAQYGLRLIECLVQLDQNLYLLFSKAALVVIATETDINLPNQPKKIEEFLTLRFKAKQGQIKVFSQEQWTAPVASGSSKSDRMVICPASSGSLAAIANGMCDNLIERAADVFLKERRQLIIVHRETPLSAIHLQNMLTLTNAGATIMPASPGFYHNPKSIEDMIDFIVARILDHLGLKQDMVKPWG
ncbi:MAG: UbiX family flavin prenyltransferase [Saccharospirillaceae bacterium]|nr:UbiX family flavin prenyltransferase [Pseudomonadales bacterium]NRB79664.1 UbiX family flavin prenyltransferase [Saccharospirillaceae bacterium]